MADLAMPITPADTSSTRPWVPTLHHARQLGREALARAVDFREDPLTGYAALAGDLEVTLRMLVDAMDAEQPEEDRRHG